MQQADTRRHVVVDEIEYFVEVRPSRPRHLQRFGTRTYAIVERPGEWQATVPLPDSVRSTAHLWYRELLELVQHARAVVGRRSAAA